MIEIKNSADFGEILIYGDIVSDSSQLWGYEDMCPSIIVDQIKELNNKPINIRINSCGGSVFGGVAIYNVLKSYKGQKTVYVDGCACSIASVIAMCGDKIVMYENSYLMIHSAWAGGIQGNSNDLREVADLLDQMDSTILNIYKTKLKDSFSVEDLQALIKAETWLKAEECVDIFNDIEIVEEEVKAYAKLNKDLFNYKNIPSNLFNAEEEEEPQEEPCKECGKVPCECEEEEPKDEAEVVVEVEEEVKDEVCPKCGQDPCECEDDKDDEEQRKEQQAKAKQLEFENALEYLKKFK